MSTELLILIAAWCSGPATSWNTNRVDECRHKFIECVEKSKRTGNQKVITACAKSIQLKTF
jgi:hypothetical protein